MMRTWLAVCILALGMGAMACSDDDKPAGNLNESFAAFGQSLGAGATAICACLGDPASAACQADTSGEACTEDTTSCMARWVFPESVQQCMLEALQADVGRAVSALDCAKGAADTLKTCVDGAGGCTAAILDCRSTFLTKRDQCLGGLGPQLALAVNACMATPQPDQGVPDTATPDAGTDTAATDTAATDTAATDTAAQG